MTKTIEELRTENTELKAKVDILEEARTSRYKIPQSMFEDTPIEILQTRLDDLVQDLEEIRAKVVNDIQWTLTSLNADKEPNVDKARVHLRESLEHLNELRIRLQQK